MLNVTTHLWSSSVQLNIFLIFCLSGVPIESIIVAVVVFWDWYATRNGSGSNPKSESSRRYHNKCARDFTLFFLHTFTSPLIGSLCKHTTLLLTGNHSHCCCCIANRTFLSTAVMAIAFLHLTISEPQKFHDNYYSAEQGLRHALWGMYLRSR